jgi:tyrosine-protein kinase Etk/Wzc
LSKMTQLGAQYLVLQNDVTVQQAILSTLKQQYETARLEEMDTSRTFQVIEKAEVPELHSGPGRTKIAIIAVLAGFFVAILAAFIMEYMDKIRTDPIESKKLAVIRSSLSFRKKQPRD